MPWESPSWSPPRRQWPWRWGGCGWAGSVLLIVRSSRKMIEDKTAQAARLLLDSRNHRRPIEALPEYCRPATTAQAYAIQRSEEHTSELQSLMRISYAVFCLKKKKKRT